MNYAYEIRRQAEAAPRAALPAIVSALWKAFGEGHLSETEVEALTGLIEALQADIGTDASKPLGGFKNRLGSRPRTGGSIERRRCWAASGRLPPGLAARFTLAEQAVLALVAAETVRRKGCRLAIGHLAAIVGVAETTVRNAIREARKLGLVTVEERRVTGFRNDTNVVRIVSAEWTAWLRMARKNTPFSSSKEAYPSLMEGGGCKFARGTPTPSYRSVDSGLRNPRRGCRQAGADPVDGPPPRIRAVGRAGRAME